MIERGVGEKAPSCLVVVLLKLPMADVPVLESRDDARRLARREYVGYNCIPCASVPSNSRELYVSRSSIPAVDVPDRTEELLL
jgi:hypothetical protein